MKTYIFAVSVGCKYKTINSCLSGGRRKWSIQELIDVCSDALSESRGRYDSVFKRTIRDDIRVLRSDILGFNAPIKQERGLYFYSDPSYSILNLRITDASLADKIYFFLISLRTEKKHPELVIILEQLCRLTKREYEEPVIEKDVEVINEPCRLEYRVTENVKPTIDTGDKYTIKLRRMDRESDPQKAGLVSEDRVKWEFNWGFIIRAIIRT